MLSRSLTVSSFMTKPLIDIWIVFVVFTDNRAVVCANNICVDYTYIGYIKKTDVIFRANGPHLRSLHTKYSLLEFIRGFPDPLDLLKVVLGQLRVTPLHSRRGPG